VTFSPASTRLGALRPDFIVHSFPKRSPSAGSETPTYPAAQQMLRENRAIRGSGVSETLRRTSVHSPGGAKDHGLANEPLTLGAGCWTLPILEEAGLCLGAVGRGPQ
jgi:hypothetical protein